MVKKYRSTWKKTSGIKYEKIQNKKSYFYKLDVFMCYEI